MLQRLTFDLFSFKLHCFINTHISPCRTIVHMRTNRADHDRPRICFRIFFFSNKAASELIITKNRMELLVCIVCVLKVVHILAFLDLNPNDWFHLLNICVYLLRSRLRYWNRSMLSGCIACIVGRITVQNAVEFI